MQPEDNDRKWQQPAAQPSGAPFIHASDDTVSDDISQEVTETSDIRPTDDPSEYTNEAYEEIVRWEAPEYIVRQKGTLWFGSLIAVTVVLMIIAIFVIKQWTFVVLVPVMAVALVIYSRRPPHTVQYLLSRQGLHADDVLSPYSEYKSFSLMRGDDQYSFLLVPRKRFKPGMWVYFPEDKGEAIVDTLAARLPMQEQQPDPIDKLIRKLRI